MFPSAFDYHAPATLREAVGLLGNGKKILAGGHSLLPLMKLRLAEPPALVDIGHIAGLDDIRQDGDIFVVGARCTHAAVAALRQAKGAVCSTASIAGVQGSGSSIPYATSKAGVINLTRSLARTLAPDVRVNAVAPGFVESPWNKDWPPERKAQSIDKTPMKRACTPQDIAEVVFFLCAGAAMITGQTIIVDGGLTL